MTPGNITLAKNRLEQAFGAEWFHPLVGPLPIPIPHDLWCVAGGALLVVLKSRLKAKGQRSFYCTILLSLKPSLTVRWCNGGHWPLQMGVLTLQQGGYEGCGHTAGAQQHSVAHLKLPLWDPPQNYRCHGSQEPHHGGLYLCGRGDGCISNRRSNNKTMRTELRLDDKPTRNFF